MAASIGAYGQRRTSDDEGCPTSLTYLNLDSTSVSGDIGAVSALTSLTNLNLGGTSVSGDIGAVSALTSLTYLRLDSTSVSGDIAR